MFSKGQIVKCRSNGQLYDGVILGSENKKDSYEVMIPGNGVQIFHVLDIYPNQDVCCDNGLFGKPHCEKSPADTRHQEHYEQFKIQPVVFIAENNLDFLTGNIIKYVLRHGKKNGVQDLEKAKHYLDMLIQKAKGETVVP